MKINKTQFPYEIISLKRFIDKIPVVFLGHNARFIESPIFEAEAGEFYDDEIGVETSYIRQKLMDIHHNQDYYSIAKEFLLRTNSFVLKPNQMNAKEIAEEAVIRHLEKFGLNTCIVPMGNNRYLVGDPEDYMIGATDHSMALINPKPLKNKQYIVLRLNGIYS